MPTFVVCTPIRTFMRCAYVHETNLARNPAEIRTGCLLNISTDRYYYKVSPGNKYESLGHCELRRKSTGPLSVFIEPTLNGRCTLLPSKRDSLWGCIQKLPDCPPGARTALCHLVQLYRYFV